MRQSTAIVRCSHLLSTAPANTGLLLTASVRLGRSNNPSRYVHWGAHDERSTKQITSLHEAGRTLFGRQAFYQQPPIYRGG